MRNKPWVSIAQGAGKNLTCYLNAYNHDVFPFNQSIFYLQRVAARRGTNCQRQTFRERNAKVLLCWCFFKVNMQNRHHRCQEKGNCPVDWESDWTRVHSSLVLEFWTVLLRVYFLHLPQPTVQRGEGTKEINWNKTHTSAHTRSAHMRRLFPCVHNHSLLSQGPGSSFQVLLWQNWDKGRVSNKNNFATKTVCAISLRLPFAPFLRYPCFCACEIAFFFFFNSKYLHIFEVGTAAKKSQGQRGVLVIFRSHVFQE